MRLIRNWIPVSFRGLATEEFNARKDAIVRDVAVQIVSALEVETRVNQAWSGMHTVYPISAEPAVFARVEPQRIVFQPPDFSRPDAVSLVLAWSRTSRRPLAPSRPRRGLCRCRRRNRQPTCRP